MQVPVTVLDSAACRTSATITSVPDIASITAALGSLKVLFELARNANDANLSAKISAATAELQGKLLEVQIQAQALIDENRDLKDQLRRLQSEADLRSRVIFEGGPQWYVRDDGIKEGPYCTSCWGLDGKLVRPSTSHLSSATHQGFLCTHHRATVSMSVEKRLLPG